MAMQGLTLRRAVPVNQTVAWMDRDLTLISVELYEDGAVLRFRTTFDQHVMTSAMVEDLMPQRPMLRVEDDLGTDYYTRFSSGGGDTSGFHIEARFTPAVPENAAVLKVAVRAPLSFEPLDPQELMRRLDEAPRWLGDRAFTNGPACTFEVLLRSGP